MRGRVERNLRRRTFARERTAALIVALLDATMMRDGNEEYARSNGSFGLTTLRREHFTAARAEVVICFPGKSDREHTICVDSAQLVRIVRQYLDADFDPVFQYLTDGGEPVPIDSQDVNDYPRDASGEAISAKVFRTWKATALVAERLLLDAPGETPRRRQRQVNAAIRAAAEALGNTPAVCRKYYVHPGLTEAFIAGALSPAKAPRPRNGYLPAEELLLSKRGEIPGWCDHS